MSYRLKAVFVWPVNTSPCSSATTDPVRPSADPGSGLYKDPKRDFDGVHCLLDLIGNRDSETTCSDKLTNAPRTRSLSWHDTHTRKKTVVCSPNCSSLPPLAPLLTSFLFSKKKKNSFFCSWENVSLEDHVICMLWCVDYITWGSRDLQDCWLTTTAHIVLRDKHSKIRLSVQNIMRQILTLFP